MFGYHMFSSGADYKLSRKLKSLTEHEIQDLNREDSMQLLREEMKSRMNKAYERSAERYNQGGKNSKVFCENASCAPG